MCSKLTQTDLKQFFFRILIYQKAPLIDSHVAQSYTKPGLGHVE